jgi:ATP-binding cassette subfamily B protein
MARYVMLRPFSHGAILAAVLGAVACSVGAQYGVRSLVDALSGAPDALPPWSAFTLLAALIASDNMLWRVASFIASHAFVRVTGDLRRDLFRHLTGHPPGFFAAQLPGVLTSRVTATSNAFFAVENMFVSNVLPPCIATAAAIALVCTVSTQMAGALVVIASIVVIAMFKIAAAGKPLHHEFANKAAAVDGEMVDVIGNLTLVKSFGGMRREHRRFDEVVSREMTARRKSLIYLERLRLLHASVTVILALSLLAWAILLWQRHEATAGQVVLVCTLGLSVLYATRDLAIALVDVTQHLARLSEALSTLLVPHELRDHPRATPLIGGGAGVSFRNITFGYKDGHTLFENFDLQIEAGQRVGLIGKSGGGKSTLFALLQRFYEVEKGEVLIGDQDISQVTEDSLREAMAIVPQDISLFNRSILENIRYSRPDASDEDVWKAAIAARCHEFIEAMPEGLETIVGDRGLKLSGGQRQRIALARAFLKDAPILLLDEATSALDHESDEMIREALGRLMRGRTVIAIAHRLSTLRSFDRLVLMEDGKLILDGPPDRLIDADTRLGNIAQAQEARVRRAA